ncbi:hypothetical protein B0E41_00705 [Hydrogenophaga sp. A37]|uniref:hybrid sensor histidine kinase/response regulator n=1 Tax=Hydrogenophaga sp. A37 TaxID=1945864 RepID=UPI0009843A1B|nr:hybrid sensor histidine kinase/response regulator [Hydrogenophaga sp. A37]OOG89235.1 hypothetical protein B0E41_00705 [Hydrogenophaga sp. A37]
MTPAHWRRWVPAGWGWPSPRSPLQQRVHEEQIALFLSTSMISIMSAMLLVTAIFAAVVYSRLRQPGVIGWAALMYLCLFIRYLWTRPYLDAPLRAAKDPHWLPVYLVLQFLNGLGWGLTPWMFIHPSDPSLIVFIFLVIGGLIGGSTAAAASVKSIYFAFALPLMVLSTVALAVQPELVYRVCSVFTVLFMLATTRFVQRFHNVLTESFTMRLEKLALVDKLAQQVTLVEAASHEKSRFMAAASHDLRQPLQAIALFTAALEQALQSTTHHLTASRLQMSVHALGTSLDTMLDISQLDVGLVRQEIRPVAVTSVFHALDNVFQPQAIEQGLELRIRASKLWVASDPQLLERLLANLVSNALKYTAAGGVLVTARRRGERVWVEVRDTGIGIPPEDHERIFDEFFQLDNPGRDRHKGLGIGLSIVRRLSRLLEHPVSVSGRPGRGSCFRVSLPPVSARALAVAEAGPRRRAEWLPRRVLLLDNETDILEAVTVFLKSFGITVVGVTQVAAARAALAQAQGEPGFDLLMCDYRLSAGEDGLQFLLDMRQCMPSLRLLMMTGETVHEHLPRIRHSGIPVLHKPVKPDALLDALCALGPAAAPTTADPPPMSMQNLGGSQGA